MDRINILNLALTAVTANCNQIQNMTEKEFDSLAEQYIDSPILDMPGSNNLTVKLNILAEINQEINEMQRTIEKCRTLQKVLAGMTGI